LRFNLGEPARQFSGRVYVSSAAENESERRFDANGSGDQRIDRPLRIAFDFESAFFDRTPHRAGVPWYATMDGAMTMPAPKFVAVGPGSAIMKSMPNDATSWATDSTKPSMPHLVAW
jgi:hypothetical protein